MAKWEFYDFVTDSTYTMELNPQQVNMGGVTKTISERGASSPTGKRILFEGRREPQVISFDGVIFNKDEYVRFENLANKNYQVRLTDDLGRVYWVYVTNFSPGRRKTSYAALAGQQSSIGTWLADYSIECTVLDWSE